MYYRMCSSNFAVDCMSGYSAVKGGEAIILIGQEILWGNNVTCHTCMSLILIISLDTHLGNRLYLFCKSLVLTR